MLQQILPKNIIKSIILKFNIHKVLHVHLTSPHFGYDQVYHKILHVKFPDIPFFCLIKAI